jgi:hypothetical protein
MGNRLPQPKAPHMQVDLEDGPCPAVPDPAWGLPFSQTTQLGPGYVSMSFWKVSTVHILSSTSCPRPLWPHLVLSTHDV